MTNDQLSIVAPRVIQPSGESLLLVDLIESLLCDDRRYVIHVFGAGTTTALRHVAECFTGQSRVAVRDFGFIEGDWQHSPDLVTAFRPSALQLAVTYMEVAHVSCELAPWEVDGFIEYLLASHPEQCASVMKRLQALDTSFASGSPFVWPNILDAMADDESLSDIQSIVLNQLASAMQGSIVSIDMVADAFINDISGARAFVTNFALPAAAAKLWKVPDILNAILARRCADRLQKRDRRVLEYWHLGELFAEIVQRVKHNDSVRTFLEIMIFRAKYSSNAAGLLLAIDPSWRPPARKGLNFSRAALRSANWAGCSLVKADLSRAVLVKADLTQADLSNAELSAANFSEADLSRATLVSANATAAIFTGANLSHAIATNAIFLNTRFRAANLSEADFSGSHMDGDFRDANFNKANLRQVVFHQAQLDGADLTDANFTRAILSSADLKAVRMCGTNFSHATMSGCDFEHNDLSDCQFTQARLGNSLFTGSTAIRAFFAKADLRGAGMAEINWEDCDLRGADLRGVAFHMGSTRCGLVGSPYPSHGTRTGFYTDDYVDLSFKPPEQIRKASLIGCDLRDAMLGEVDFYLVDLRGARFDSHHRARFLACGAILEG